MSRGKTLTVRISTKLHQQLLMVAASKHWGQMNDCYEAAFKAYVKANADDVRTSIEANLEK